MFQASVSANNVRYINTTNSDAGTVNQLVGALSDQLTQNKNFKDIEKAAIAVTSFVCLDDFKAKSRLSNILSENLIHEMQVRGYKVIDFKIMDTIQIDAQGDFLFSRDVAKLRKSLNIDYALTGTYVKYKNGTVVNARIIDLKTHVVLSSAQILIPSRVEKRISSVGNQIPNFQPNTIQLSK
jgi:TolB-like protein